MASSSPDAASAGGGTAGPADRARRDDPAATSIRSDRPCAHCTGTGVAALAFDHYGVWLVSCMTCGARAGTGPWCLAAEIGIAMVATAGVLALLL